MSKRAPRLRYDLKTPFSDGTYDTWDIHPRPQMRRDAYLSLCGPWTLSVSKQGTKAPVGIVTVPFPPEAALSGIGRTLEPGQCWIYERSFTLPDTFRGRRILLHFGAIDQIARLFCNDTLLTTHEGGYLPFTVELTDVLTDGENRLRIEVSDDLDLDLPYGKQSRKRGGMWYTPISGIWQAVWLECVPRTYVEQLKIDTTLRSVSIGTVGGTAEKTIAIETPDGSLETTYTGDCVTLEIPNPIHWTPDTPHLYPFTLTCGEDRITSYFALRTVTIESSNGQAYICVNGKPTFFHGLLDQGYFSDGIYTPASPQGYESDILTMKQLGFNMLRKHIKIEPELFYYYCDKHGMFVFQDMVNSGTYNFLIDTALPTVGLKRGITHRASSRRRAAFETAAKETTELLYNHPSVVYYTIFNEGWGQYDADRLYRELKAADPSRVWDATSGWFFEHDSDVQSEHIYFKKIDLKSDPVRPLVLSEFGGYVLKDKEHSFNPDNTYGYKLFDTAEALTDALAALYRNEVLPMIGRGLNAAVMTQVSDVEDETNGMVTYDRQVIKPDTAVMATVAKELYARFEQHTNRT